VAWLWRHSVGSPTALAVLLCVILGVDIVVWAATRSLLRRNPESSHFIEYTLQAFGSWYALGAMAFFSIAWAYYDTVNNHSDSTLDIGISIWTMLLDVLVIIGANYTRAKDRKVLAEIAESLQRVERGATHRQGSDRPPHADAPPGSDSPGHLR
jgi:hypothetical protein